MKELVISLSKVQKLKEELNILNKEYLKIYEEMEDLNKKKESLESIYMSKLGALIFLKFEKEIEYRKVRIILLKILFPLKMKILKLKSL
ncbi:hypothetical protein [Clostridium tertium]|uniref:hypothetical protein n=1 Tax=Clostridium tertium TaxID=1559 RepID=UPI0034A2DEDB